MHNMHSNQSATSSPKLRPWIKPSFITFEVATVTMRSQAAPWGQLTIETRANHDEDHG